MPQVVRLGARASRRRQPSWHPRYACMVLRQRPPLPQGERPKQALLLAPRAVDSSTHVSSTEPRLWTAPGLPLACLHGALEPGLSSAQLDELVLLGRGLPVHHGVVDVSPPHQRLPTRPRRRSRPPPRHASGRLAGARAMSRMNSSGKCSGRGHLSGASAAPRIRASTTCKETLGPQHT